MPTDLTAAIRAALHAGDIDESDLLRPTMAESRPRRTAVPLAVAGVAASIAVLAVVLAVLLPTRHDGVPPANGKQSAGFVGYRWRVVEVHDPTGNLVVPGSLRATFAFTPGGRVEANDGVNGVSGRYTVTRTGYAVRDVVSTGAGYAGGNSQLVQVRRAVDHMLFADSSSGIEVHASVSGRILTLRRTQYVLTLQRAGRQGGTDTGAPTPTGAG